MVESLSSGSSWNGLHCAVNSWTAPYWNISADLQLAGGHQLVADLPLPPRRLQSWLSGAAPNYGFVVHQNETQGTNCESKFYSADYDSGMYAPQLIVNYDPGPLNNPSTDSTVYSLGANATITASVASYYPADVHWLEVGLNLTKTDGSPYLGVLGWFKSSSYVPSSNWHQLGALPDGSVCAYWQDPSNPTYYGANAISLTSASDTTGSGSDQEPGYMTANFQIQFASAFGAQVAVSPDMRCAMGPSSATTWGSGSSLSGDLGEPPASVGWTAEPGAAFSVIQTKLTTTTASAGGNSAGSTRQAAPTTRTAPAAARSP